MARLLSTASTTRNTTSANTSTGTTRRRIYSQIFIWIALTGALLRLDQNSDYVRSLGQLYVANMVNQELLSPPCTSNLTEASPKSKEYPNRTDLVYYVPARGHRDRSGSAIMDMLKGQAYSFHHGIAFGGACGDTPHQATNEAMIEAVGLDPLLKYKCPPPEGTDTGGVKHEMITRNHFFHVSSKELFNDEWLEFIHNQVQPKAKRFIDNESALPSRRATQATNTTSNYTIAVHVRRGDVDPCGHWSFRYLPNSHYLGMIDHYKRQAPPGQTVQCQVFSETRSLIETFDEFTQRGCELILGGDPTLAWKTMMDANVVIMSLSSFSNLPALLNPKAIVAYTPSLSEPLRDSWKWHVYKHSNKGWRQWIDKCDEHAGIKKR